MTHHYFCCQCWWLHEPNEAHQEPVVDAVCPSCGHDQAQRHLYGQDLVRMKEAVHEAVNAMNTIVLRLEKQKKVAE